MFGIEKPYFNPDILKVSHSGLNRIQIAYIEGFSYEWVSWYTLIGENSLHKEFGALEYTTEGWLVAIL